VTWHDADVLDLHPADAELRGVADGTWVELTSRAGSTVLRARVTEEVPAGVVYTTFHYPASGVNVVTTESSDWATNCPEYKVTAVEVTPWSPDRRAPAPESVDRDRPAGAEDHPEDLRDRLIAMANQIAASVPDRERAAEETAQHLTAFWPRAMIEELQSSAAQDAGQVSPVTRAALGLLTS
jgi:formate dehydrogenase major subunit